MMREERNKRRGKGRGQPLARPTSLEEYPTGLQTVISRRQVHLRFRHHHYQTTVRQQRWQCR